MAGWTGNGMGVAAAATEVAGETLTTVTTETTETTETTDTSDGLWYFTDTGIPDIHASGITGQGVTVAIIDSPINLDVADLADANILPRTGEVCPGFTGVEVSERARHGTAMASLIVGNGEGIDDEPGVLGVAPDATILHYAVLNVAVDECAAPLADLVADAIEQGADILNLSISYNSPREAQNAIDLALEAGLVVNVAVQNETSDRLDLLSSLPGVVSIENVDRDGQPDAYSVTGPQLDFVAPGAGIRMLKTDFSGYELDDGTSPATAWVSGVFALAQSASPDATGNQLIQAAIRSAHDSTNTSTHDTGSDTDGMPRTDSEGFGFLDPSSFVNSDPSQFPDENPLLESDPGDADADSDDASSADEQNSTDPSEASAELSSWSMLFRIGFGFLAATALYVVVLIIRRRRHRRWRA